MKILCTADIHIGRRPSRLPDRVDGSSLSCARAWDAIVETAIAQRVDLVAIAGDLVDEANRFYEAAGPVEIGVGALASHGIRTVAVAGNHDHDILPWIAGNFTPQEFILLGQGGRWERLTIQGEDGAPVLHVDGWSFPAKSYLEDPLSEYPRLADDGVPVLGLLHADLDQTGSRHAPVQLASLRAQRVGLWLLGHVHRPQSHEQRGAASVLYPGSPQAMDPGETGPHGAWMVEVDAGHRFSARPVPLSLVRYETLEVDASGVAEEGELGRRIHDAVSTALRQRVEEEDCGPLRYLSLRLILTGRTRLHRWLQTRDTDFAAELESRHGSVTALVEQVRVATRPPRELEELARGQDAPAVLARLALGLERDELDEEGDRLLQAALTRAIAVRGEKPYRRLDDREAAPDRQAVSAILGEHALLLLDELLAQKEAS